MSCASSDEEDPASTSTKQCNPYAKLQPGILDDAEDDAHSSPIKLLLTWFVFAIILLMELWTHVKYGISSEVLENEEDCTEGIRDCHMAHYLEVSEGLCRVFLSAAIVDGLMQLCRCCAEGRLNSDSCQKCCDREMIGGRCVTVVGACFALVTLCIGTWHVVVGVGEHGDLPHWAAVYCHIADAFCAAVVASALVGLIIDCVLAACGRSGEKTTWAVARKVLECEKGLEDHSEIHSDGKHVLERTDIRHGLELLVLYVVSVLALVGYILSLQDKLPSILNALLDEVGVICWVGISYWLVEMIYGACAVGIGRKVPMPLTLFMLRPSRLSDKNDEGNPEDVLEMYSGSDVEKMDV